MLLGIPLLGMSEVFFSAETIAPCVKEGPSVPDISPSFSMTLALVNFLFWAKVNSDKVLDKLLAFKFSLLFS